MQLRAGSHAQAGPGPASPPRCCAQHSVHRLPPAQRCPAAAPASPPEQQQQHQQRQPSEVPQWDAAAASSGGAAPGRELDVSGFVAAAGVAAAACVLLSARAARAEERAWKPRRHYRRMGERIRDTWAADVVQEEERAYDRSLTEQRRREQLRRQQEEREAEQRRAEEAARRQRAQELYLKEAAAARSQSELPLSMKVGGVELAPFVVWGGMGIMAFGTLQGLIAANNARRGRGRGAGKWVYDRSLGGKKVWVPDYEAGAGAGSGAPAARLSDLELERVASLAAAAAAAPPEGALQREFSLPAWWNPGPRFVADPSVQASRTAAAERLLARIESSKLKGSDYDVADIVELRRLCQEGCVSLSPRTVGSRDAIFRAALDAATAAALDPVEGGPDLGDATPTRFVCALAYDLNMPEERATAFITAATAAATRARLLEALTGLKEAEVAAGRQGETQAVLGLIRLSSLLAKMPVLEPGGREVALVSESLQGTFEPRTRLKAFHVLGQLAPEAAPLAAELLGLDPGRVVPGLMEEVAASRRRAEEQAAAASTSQQEQEQQQ